jgi:hypothetical protein
MRIPILSAIALTMSCSSAVAQERCPELTRLRGEATEFLKRATGKVTTQESCEAYTRFAVVWREIANYANEHRKTCDISDAARMDFEKRHTDAVKLSKDNCVGRRLDLPVDIR